MKSTRYLVLGFLASIACGALAQQFGVPARPRFVSVGIGTLAPSETALDITDGSDHGVYINERLINLYDQGADGTPFGLYNNGSSLAFGPLFAPSTKNDEAWDMIELLSSTTLDGNFAGDDIRLKPGIGADGVDENFQPSVFLSGGLNMLPAANFLSNPTPPYISMGGGASHLLLLKTDDSALPTTALYTLCSQNFDTAVSATECENDVWSVTVNEASGVAGFVVDAPISSTDGATNFAGDVAAGGAVSGNSVSATTTVSAGNATITGGATVGGTLIMNGGAGQSLDLRNVPIADSTDTDVEIDDSLTVNGDLTVTGSINGGGGIGAQFAGYIEAQDATENLPSGWSASYTSNVYTITHGLSINPGTYTFVCTVFLQSAQAGTTDDYCVVKHASNNSLEVRTFDPTGIQNDVGFTFVLSKLQ